MTAFPEGAQERVWRTFAAELAAMAGAPLLIRRMIREHRGDEAGRCRSPRCRTGGQGYHLPWPCTLYGVAIEARRVLDRHQAERRAEGEAVRKRVTTGKPRHLVAVDDLRSGARAEATAVDPLDEEIHTFFALYATRDPRGT